MYLGYQNNKIKFYTEQPLSTELYNLDKVEYTEDEYVLDGEKYVLKDEAWEEKQAQKEHEHIQELSMTRSDFFDGTIMAWGVGQDELLNIIQDLLSVLPLENTQKLIAINNYKNALNFYRKHDLFKILVDIDIPLNDTLQLTITDESLDKFFDEVSKGNKATAWQYLPQPVEISIEPSTDSIIEDDIDDEIIDNPEEDTNNEL